MKLIFQSCFVRTPEYPPAYVFALHEQIWLPEMTPIMWFLKGMLQQFEIKHQNAQPSVYVIRKNNSLVLYIAQKDCNKHVQRDGSKYKSFCCRMLSKRSNSFKEIEHIQCFQMHNYEVTTTCQLF